MFLPRPNRPDVQDERARRLLEWVDVVAYVIWVAIGIAVAIVLLLEGTHLDIATLLDRGL